MNKIILIGRLGRDPEMNYTPGGVAVTRFSLAVNRVTKSGTGEKQEETEWFNIVTWNQLAERCEEQMRFMTQIALEGSAGLPLELLEPRPMLGGLRLRHDTDREDTTLFPILLDLRRREKFWH